MKVKLNQNSCVVTREKGDPKFYGVQNAAGESNLLYQVKKILKKKGHKVIKKRMHKDGHMVAVMQQYLRTEKGYEPSFYIWNPAWDVEGAEEDYNKGKVILSLDRNIWIKD